MKQINQAQSSAPRFSAGAQRFAVAGFGATGILVLLAWPLLRGQFIVSSDLGNYILPLKYFYARCLATGDDFTWCPDLFGGFYLHGEGQLGMMHPLNLLAYKLLPFTFAYNLESWIHYPLLLAGTYLLLRRWRLPPDASLFGAMAFAFSGFNLLHVVHFNALAVICHIPWLLLSVDILLRGADLRLAAVASLAVSLLTTSQVLLGYPQYVLFSLILVVVYAAFLAWFGTGRKRWLPLAGAVLLGALGGSIQLVPTWEALSRSVRAEPTFEFLYEFSLVPINLLQFVSPYGLDGRVYGGNAHEFALYNGASITVLSVWTLARLHKLRNFRPLAAIGLFLCFLGLVLALGEFGYLYRLQAHLPLLRSFRAPCRYILFVHLGSAILAAVAFVDLTRCAASPGAREPRAVWITAGVSLLVCVGALVVQHRAAPQIAVHVASPRLVIFSAALIVAAALLTAASARAVPGAIFALLLFTAVDQAGYGWLYLDPEQQQELSAYSPTPPGQGRIVFPTDQYLLCRTTNVFGYAGLTPDKVMDLTCSNALRASAVSWNYVAGNEGCSWQPVVEPAAYARLLAQAVRSESSAQDIEDIDVATTALVDESLDLPPGDPGKAELKVQRSGHLLIETQADAPRLLVVAESMHPGWSARLDGEPCRLLAVYGDLIGCVVPAGIHRVEIKFRPWSLRWGAALSALGLGLTILMFAASLAQAGRKVSVRSRHVFRGGVPW
jgi:hypothetical protein